MQDEITKNYNEKVILDKYSAGKKVEVVMVVDGKKDTSACASSGVITEDEGGMHIIELIDPAKPDEPFSMPVLDAITLGKLPTEGIRYYKLNNGYSLSLAGDGATGETTFGKDFVCTSMKAVEEGMNISMTFNLQK